MNHFTLDRSVGKVIYENGVAVGIKSRGGGRSYIFAILLCKGKFKITGVPFVSSNTLFQLPAMWILAKSSLPRHQLKRQLKRQHDVYVSLGTTMLKEL